MYWGCLMLSRGITCRIHHSHRNFSDPRSCCFSEPGQFFFFRNFPKDIPGYKIQYAQHIQEHIILSQCRGNSRMQSTIRSTSRWLPVASSLLATLSTRRIFFASLPSATATPPSTTPLTILRINSSCTVTTESTSLIPKTTKSGSSTRCSVSREKQKRWASAAI